MTDNAFGKVRTLVHCEELTEKSLTHGLKNGNSVVTDGPVVNFEIRGTKNGKLITGKFGQSIEVSESTLNIKILWKSTEEFGQFQDIKLVKNGSFLNINELTLKTGDKFNGSRNISIIQKKKIVYYRVEAYSRKGDEKFCCYTNPIWIIKK